MKFGPPYFIGGLVCIDFCNTTDHLHSPPMYDYFKDYGTLLDWAKAAGVLPKNDASSPASKNRSFADLLTARDQILRLLWPISRGEKPANTDLAAFNRRLQKVSSGLRLSVVKGRYVLSGSSDDPLERIHTAVVRSAADLLVSGQFARIRHCGECGWIFYDNSRNHLRRWCTMKICGNRAKARRHYQRVKKSRIGGS
jgi:predicted RNA-binding Zn ribbon-like protein